MQALIKDILEFSKVSSDKNNFVNTDLNVVVEEVLADIDPEVQDKKAKINFKGLPSLDVNPGLMRPLFSNLIGNAIKYRKKDVDPIINIYADQKETVPNGSIDAGNRKFCRIYVEDNGIGFDQKYAEQIFNMFVRLHGNSEYEGTGIGLALCKQIVDKHEGFISVLSKENSGSTFIVSLPIQ